MNVRADECFIDVRLATLTGTDGYGELADGALAVRDGTIVYVGPRAAAPSAVRTTSLEGRWMTPGLIDAHTHLVYGGNRAAEWEQRLQGMEYAEIARRGGGILATVRATRAASFATLLRAARGRLAALCAHGVTTVEIKSGYGLDLETELRMLRVARELGRALPVTVVTSYLGAHAVPPEYRERPDAYLDFVCDTVLPAVAREGLADAVDAFCETIAFTPAQVARVLARARDFGLPVTLHADQLTDGGGAALAARFGARSADHLEYTGPEGIAALAAAGTAAVVLPGAFYFLRERRAPPIAALRAAGVPVALATDCNPGTSPLVSPLLALNFACTLLRFTPDEALRGMTAHAARALGLVDRGTLQRGRRADLAVWDVEHPAELAYGLGANPAHAVYVAGRRVDPRALRPSADETR